MPITPFFELPHLVLEQVFGGFDLQDLFHLSLTSHRSKRLVKFYRRKPLPVEIHVDAITSKITIKSEKSTVTTVISYPNSCLWNPEIAKINRREIQISTKNLPENLDFVAYFSNLQEGLKLFVNFFSEIFDLKNEKIENFTIGNRTSVIDFFQNLKIRNLIFAPTVDLDFSGFFFKKLWKNIDHLIINSEFGTQKFPKIEKLTIDPGSWVTVDDLKNFESKNVQIWESRLKSSDVNQFYKNWKFGNFRVEYLHVELEEQRLHRVVAGLRATRLPNRQMKIQNPFNPSEIHTPHGGYQIRSADGKLANIHFLGRSILFHVVNLKTDVLGGEADHDGPDVVLGDQNFAQDEAVGEVLRRMMR